MRTNHGLLSDNNRASLSAVSSLSEGLRQADDGGPLVRNTVDERLESAWNMAAVSDEEHRHIVAGDDLWCGTTETRYEDHRSVVENAAGEHRPSVVSVGNILEKHRPSPVAADSHHHAVSNVAVTENADKASHGIYHADGDATVNVAPLPQPSTARSKTSEYISYKDDFTEMSDQHGTHSTTDSRSAELLPLPLTV